MRAIRWIPTWQGLDGFQKSLHPCALNESSLSIGRVNRLHWSGQYPITLIITLIKTTTSVIQHVAFWAHNNQLPYKHQHCHVSSCVEVLLNIWCAGHSVNLSQQRVKPWKHLCRIILSIENMCEVSEKARFRKIFLTLMLVVGNFSRTKWYKKSEKVLKFWDMGTHLRVFSESYPMNTNMTGFRWFSRIFVSLWFGQR